jgi:hypothetical protein
MLNSGIQKEMLGELTKFQESECDRADMIAVVRELIRRAILTLAVLPDPDARYRHHPRSSWPDIIRSVAEAYGYTAPTVRRFAPSPRDISRYLIVLDWLAWYRRERDRADVDLITAWALGAPAWKLEQRFRRTRRTLLRWIDGVVEAVIHRFRADASRMALDLARECHSISRYREYDGGGASDLDDDSLGHGRVWVSDAPVACDISAAAQMIARQRRRRARARRRRKRRVQ